MEIIFHSHANKTNFHKRGCALRLILKVRVFGTWKWPIVISFNEHSGMLPLNCGLHWLILLIPWKDCKYIHSRIWFDHFLLIFEISLCVRRLRTMHNKIININNDKGMNGNMTVFKPT